MGSCCSKVTVAPMPVPNESSRLLTRPSIHGADGQPHRENRSNNNAMAGQKHDKNEVHDAESSESQSAESSESENAPLLFKHSGDDDDQNKGQNGEKNEGQNGDKNEGQSPAESEGQSADKDEGQSTEGAATAKQDGEMLPPGLQYLKKYLDVPLPMCEIKVPEVERVIQEAIDPYNSVLRVLCKLRTHREAIKDWARPQLEERPVTLKIAMIHLSDLLKPNVVIQLWRNGTNNLELFYNANSIRVADVNNCILRVRCAVDCINKLEMAAQKDPVPKVELVLRLAGAEQGLDEQVQNVHGSSTQGQQYLTKYRNAMELMEHAPTLWQMLLKEKRDIIDEFLKAFRFIMNEPKYLHRPKERRN